MGGLGLLLFNARERLDIPWIDIVDYLQYVFMDADPSWSDQKDGANYFPKAACSIPIHVIYHKITEMRGSSSIPTSFTLIYD